MRENASRGEYRKETRHDFDPKVNVGRGIDPPSVADVSDSWGVSGCSIQLFRVCTHVLAFAPESP